MNDHPTDKTPTPAEILTKAADVIDQRGWHQGGFTPPDSDPETAPVCATAAIDVAAGFLPNGYGIRSVGVDAAIAARGAKRVLRHHLRMSVVDWNDDPKRTAEQVTSIMRSCAAELAGSAK